jgi:membrane-bound inhibitor of C-type lysozyme
MHHRFALCLLITLALTACETPKKRMPVTPQPMSCSGNRPASITLYSPEEAKLTFEGKSHTLKRVITASGVKYGNNSISYWNKGIDALITEGDKMTSCTYVPKSGL